MQVDDKRRDLEQVQDKRKGFVQVQDIKEWISSSTRYPVKEGFRVKYKI
jgi:hypothetical protein